MEWEWPRAARSRAAFSRSGRRWCFARWAFSRQRVARTALAVGTLAGLADAAAPQSAACAADGAMTHPAVTAAARICRRRNGILIPKSTSPRIDLKKPARRAVMRGVAQPG